MRAVALKPAAQAGQTVEEMKAIGEWLAPIIACFVCIGMLIAVGAILLGPGE